MRESDIFDAAILLQTKKELINVLTRQYDHTHIHITPNRTSISVRVSTFKEMVNKELNEVNKQLKAIGATGAGA